MLKKGRHIVKLSSAQQKEILMLRATEKLTYKKLAARFGVSRPTIYNVLSGRYAKGLSS